METLLSLVLGAKLQSEVDVSAIASYNPTPVVTTDTHYRGTGRIEDDRGSDRKSNPDEPPADRCGSGGSTGDCSGNGRHAGGDK